MLYDSKSLRYLDLGILSAVFVIIICGLIAIYSATFGSEAHLGQVTFKKQIVWVILGAFVLGISIFTPIRFFHKYALSIYLASIGLLFAVLFVGTGSGSSRWIALGPLGFQPAEFAKISVVIILAKYLCDEKRRFQDIKEFIVPFILVFIPLVLIMKQPDLGSALVFLALILPMLHWAGMPHIVLFALVAPLISLVSAFNYYSFFVAMLIISFVFFFAGRGMFFFLVNFFFNIGVGILTPLMWNILKDYQQKRILTFLGIEADPQGLGYQVIQSKVAIGSGGLFGKGFLHGTQTHLRFLPEQHTDFIFCVVGEEFGFLGVIVILALFLYIIIKAINIAVHVKSKFTSLLVFGGVIILFFQIMVNVGMTVEIMPVTGLPLPFLSYGGSSMLSSLLIIGLILNASRKRFEYL